MSKILHLNVTNKMIHLKLFDHIIFDTINLTIRIISAIIKRNER